MGKSKAKSKALKQAKKYKKLLQSSSISNIDNTVLNKVKFPSGNNILDAIKSSSVKTSTHTIKTKPVTSTKLQKKIEYIYGPIEKIRARHLPKRPRNKAKLISKFNRNSQNYQINKHAVSTMKNTILDSTEHLGNKVEKSAKKVMDTLSEVMSSNVKTTEELQNAFLKNLNKMVPKKETTEELQNAFLKDLNKMVPKSEESVTESINIFNRLKSFARKRPVITGLGVAGLLGGAKKINDIFRKRKMMRNLKTAGLVGGITGVLAYLSSKQNNNLHNRRYY